MRVDLTRPDILLTVEVRDDAAYIYTREIPGWGGMPVGTAGSAALLLSGGIDSPVAGWMMMKRGLRLIAVHFYSFPYTGELARRKVLDLAASLARWSGPIPVHVVPFTAIQGSTRKRQSLTLLMRRAMMQLPRSSRQGGMRRSLPESLGRWPARARSPAGYRRRVALPHCGRSLGLTRMRSSSARGCWYIRHIGAPL